MNNRVGLFTLLILASSLVAQEGLRPLQSNINYHYSTGVNNVETQLQTPQVLAKSAGNSLSIPFKEDFSYSYKNTYPAQNVWMDSSVYVNSGFPIAPLSLGVATFDGLNKHGYPYLPSLSNLQLSYPADTLTSRPINLKQTPGPQPQPILPGDNVALSFYYQMGGRGDYPETNDSLIVDFFNPTTMKWAQGVWRKNGPSNVNLNDTIFKRAFIWIKDTAFLKDGFQFRFRNYATTAGDFDHWNIDYILLDRNRDSIADTAFNDISFAGMPTPFLKDYSSMPHEQYNSSEMTSNISLRVRNNWKLNINYQSLYTQEYDKVNFLTNNYNSGFDNIAPFNGNGYSTFSKVATPPVNTFTNVNRNLDFKIIHALGRLSTDTSDFLKNNDTLVQYQQFRNFYAFDDGSAEAAYYVLGTGGKMAVKVRLNQLDTILAVRIYFAHVGNANLKQTFTLSVWDAGSNGPGNLILSDTARVIYPKYGLREIPEYTFALPPSSRALNPGTYYIGFKQGVQTGINVGFDMNYDHRTSLYFDAGQGWKQSQFYGSVMIRPVFGSFNGTPLSINEKKVNENSILVYPNPADNNLNVLIEQHKNTRLALYSITGKLLVEREVTGENLNIATNGLDNGVYFLLVKKNGAVAYRCKVIISH